MLVPAAMAQQTAVHVEGPSDGTVGVDRPGTFTFNVTNGAEPTGSPADDRNHARVTVAVSGMPDGWNAAVGPADFRLAAGQSRQVTLQVTVTPESAARATLTVTAILTTQLEGLDPVLGNIPGASQTATSSAAMDLERNESVTRNVLESVGNWIYVLFAAVLAAVLVATKLIADARRVTVSLTSPERRKAVPAGGRVAIAMTVRNLARKDDTVVFQVSPVGDGWAAFLPVAELELPRAGSEEIHLVVIAPATAAPGDRQEILVSAHSAQGPRHPASITCEAYVA